MFYIEIYLPLPLLGGRREGEGERGEGGGEGEKGSLEKGRDDWRRRLTETIDRQAD